MKLSQKSKDKIIQAYIGDLHWLDVIEKEVKEYDSEDKQDILRLINILYKMNYVVVETETEKYTSKYNEQAQDLYSEMKLYLTEMLGISDMWEVI